MGQLFQRYKKAQDISSSLRKANEDMQFTVRIGAHDVEIMERKEGERYWNTITREYAHEMPEMELEKNWTKLQKETERKEFEEYTPEKEARESEKNKKYDTDEEEFLTKSQAKETDT